MEIEFKFKIGQVVQHVLSAEWNVEEQKQEDSEKNRWASVMRSNPQRWFILERMTQECPGGVQKHYVCRGVTRDGGVTKDYFKFNEIELAEVSNGK